MSVQWRTRVVIELHAPLSEKPFSVGKHVVIARNELRGDNWPKNITIIDVVLRGLSTSDVERAHIAGIDVANTFLDRVSVVAYSPCSIVQIISTAPQSVKVGRPFTLATHDQIREVESPMINPADISGFQTIAENSVFHEAAHHARKALSEGTAEQHLLHLHIAAERIAVSETTERVKNTCPSCGASWDGPLASRRAVRTLLTNRKVSSADCDDAIQYRSRIAHGGGKRDLQFYERVTELAGAVEGAVLSTIAERCGLKILRRTGVVVGLPISIHQAVKNSDGSFSLLSTRWKAPIRFPAVSDEASLPGGAARVGFPTNPDGMPCIDSAAWPE